MNTKLLRDYILDATELVEQQGMRLKLGTDFNEFKRLANVAKGRSKVNHSFDPDDPEGKDATGYWLVGYNSDDDIIHTQAMKVVELEKKLLSAHLRSSADQYRIRGFDVDMSRAEVALTEDAEKVHGRLAYHGEVWSAIGRSGLKMSELGLLARIMLASGLYRLSPDFLFGFMSPKDAYRGLAARLGYVHLEQRSLIFPQKSGAPPLEGWMVWMSAAEAMFNLRIEPAYFTTIMNSSAQKTRKETGIAA